MMIRFFPEGSTFLLQCMCRTNQALIYMSHFAPHSCYASQGDDLLQTTGETITWTQRLSLTSSNTLTYQVVNGQSTTWGAFGQAQGFPALTFTAQVSSLANYSPMTSVGNSGVGWQSNRVTQMTLTQVRYYSGGQLVATDTTSRSVNLSIGQ